jgi:DNA-binding NarL/FixJ family response regulator
VWLESCGFEVKSPASIAEAKKLLEEEGETFDVMLLDMKLEQYEDHLSETGAKLAIEFLQKRRKTLNWNPEILILSAFKEREYFEDALHLGVAAYLYKEGASNEDVTRHLRALALRRAVSVARPEISEDISKLTVASPDVEEALLAFFHTRLIPEMKACLGIPFFLLLTYGSDLNGTDGKRTIYCGGSFDWPRRGRLYETIQAYAHSDADDTEPFILQAEKLPRPADEVEASIIEKVSQAALMPIAANEIRLAIGLIKEHSPDTPYDEDPSALAKVLAKYFRSQVITALLQLIIQIKMKVTEQRAMLSATADICESDGQLQTDTLQEVERDAEGEPRMAEFLRNNDAFQSAKRLARDIYQTGGLLAEISKYANPLFREEKPPLPPVSMVELAHDAWEDLRIAEGIKLNVTGDCHVRAEKGHIWLMFSKLLQWLAQQRWRTSDDMPQVSIRCAECDGWAEAILEDRSARLFKPLRHRLFAPMTLAATGPEDKADQWERIDLTSMGKTDRPRGPGLYLALYLVKVLVELRYGGQVLDCSDELEGDVGHRFVVRLPAA